MKKNVLLKVMTIIAIVVISQNTVNAANWFVEGETNTNTTGGTTWATAVTLTKAAGSAAAGDVIYLAAGTYTQTAYVSLNKAYTIVGGFSGTENESTISPSMSNPSVNITKFTQASSSTFRILSMGAALTGTLTLQDITFDGLSSNQSGQAIECSSGSTLTTIIQNCIFKNISASATNVAGAINVNNVSANVTVQNCWFENVTSGNNGGAMSTNAKTGNTVTVTGCTFKNTTAPSTTTNYSGGAIYANGTVGTNAYTLQIDNCTFNGTKAATGGAIYTGVAITLNINNSTFSNCQTVNSTAGNGHGGAIIFQAPFVNITGCTFDHCTDNGRGLIYWNAASTKAIIKKSIFTNNISGGTTQNSGAVFGIQNATSFVTIDSCYATKNTSSANSGNMSASVLYSAAGKSNIAIKNSTFVGNIGSSTVTRAVTYASGATAADTIAIQNSIISNNTNLATNDSLRDVSQFSATYSKISYSNIIANGRYLNLGDQTSALLQTIYTNFLTAGNMNSLTTPTTINDIVAAANVILTASKPSLVESNWISTQLFTTLDHQLLSKIDGNIQIYSFSGLMVKSVKVVIGQNISLPTGPYFIKATTKDGLFVQKIVL
jgi:hypothetical protein